MNPFLIRKKLGADIIARYKTTLPPPDFKQTVLDDLRDRVTNIGKKCINRCQFEYFGSFASGFCKKGADADLSLTWSGLNCLLQGQETFDDLVDKKLLRFAKCASEEGMVDVRHVASRIPVVQFQDNVHTEIICDVSVGNVGGVENSKILKLIHDVHPVIPLYIYTIKEWGKSRQLIAPEFGTFNSFTTTVLALSVLQELGLLPVFTRQTGQWGELTFDDAKFTLSNFKQHAALAGLDPKNDEAMADALMYLVSKFAEYYTKFDFENGTVSLTHPRQLRTSYKELVTAYLDGMKESKRVAWELFEQEYASANKTNKNYTKNGVVDENELSQAMHNEEIQRTSTSPFVVVDFVNYVCCGRRVHLPKKQYVLDQFRDLNNLMKTTTTIDDLFRVTNQLKPIVTDFDRSTGARRVTRF